jgi:cellobiose-specific phosphotransferase system component IIB
MSRRLSVFVAMICALVLTTSALAQEKKEPGKAIVSIYRIAPGKHVDFLKWMAAREALSKEAGVGATQWYVHTDGDSWDYVLIAPQTTPEQDKKLDALAAKAGLTGGYASALELRQYMASHTDTMAMGPMSAAEIVAMAK